MKRDLAHLYSQLDLQPDCTLEELKRTYQRRIAELHPDKGADAATPEVRLLLPELIWLYAAATRFYRRHGRLPGAALPPREPTAGSPQTGLSSSPTATPSADPPSAASRSPPLGDAHEMPPRHTLAWAILLLVLLIVTSSWGWLMPTTPEESMPATAGPEAAVAANTLGYLELGMDEAAVVAIQGEPTLVRDTRWNYGPSWLEFEEGRVVDWSSSPLQPLKTATPSPAP